MLCLVQDGANYLVASPQPSQVSECFYILASPAEVSVNAWALTAAEGLDLSMAIAGLWVVAVVFSIAITLLKQNEGNENV